MKTISFGMLLAGVAMTFGMSARGSVIETTNSEDWEQGLFPYQTISFTEFASGTIITDQYSDLGIMFTDGNDLLINNATSFPQDGFGLRGGINGANDVIHISFTSPHYAIAAFYPGAMRIELYNDGSLIYTSSDFGGIGNNFFGGVISTTPFDAAIIRDWFDSTMFIDNLYLSNVAIPAPGALSLLAFASLLRRTRKRVS